MRCKYKRGEVLLTALSTAGFQILELSLQGEDPVTPEAQQELDPGRACQLRSPTRREPAELIELDGGQHSKLAGESDLIGLFGQEHRFWNVDQ